MLLAGVSKEPMDNQSGRQEEDEPAMLCLVKSKNATTHKNALPFFVIALLTLGLTASFFRHLVSRQAENSTSKKNWFVRKNTVWSTNW